MAEEKEQETKEEEKPAGKKKKGKLPLILLIAAIVLVQIGVSFFIVTKVLTKGDREDTSAEGSVVEKSVFGPIFEIKDIVVNLAESKGTRFLKVSLTFEVENIDVVAELTAKQPVFMDILINILSSKSLSDVDSREEKNSVRLEVIDLCNSSLESGVIRNLYFTEFVVQ